MGIEVTPEAAAVLRRSLELAHVDPAAGGGVRLRAAKALGGGTDVQVELAEGPSSEDVVVEQDGVRVFVDSSVTKLYPDAIVALEPQHDTVVVRPAGG